MNLENDSEIEKKGDVMKISSSSVGEKVAENELEKASEMKSKSNKMIDKTGNRKK